MKISVSIILTVSLVITTLMSCVPLKDHVFDNREIKLDKNNLFSIEGEYEIVSADGKALFP